MGTIKGEECCFWIWLRPRYKIPDFFTIAPSSPPLWRFAAVIAAIRRLYIGVRVRYKYYRKKHSRSGLACSRSRADRGLSRLTSVLRIQ